MCFFGSLGFELIEDATCCLCTCRKKHGKSLHAWVPFHYNIVFVCFWSLTQFTLTHGDILWEFDQKKHSGVGGTEIFSLNAPRRLLTPVLLSLTLLVGVGISGGHILIYFCLACLAHTHTHLCMSLVLSQVICLQMFSSIKSPFPRCILCCPMKIPQEEASKLFLTSARRWSLAALFRCHEERLALAQQAVFQQ